MCGRRDGWGQMESSAREYLVSGALQEMKNENESGGCAGSTCHRRRLPFLTGN